ncbi:hypothetical protein DB30_03913 [Enhygromyxa salina]|uniref:Outer membrane protein beta-barrel domain-containing protein n=1 Tax=Enhygromyxa salina TaxID=215803 RepID=A0A0C1ZH14_9BACT|nr:hypothetical protein [Enhygromyxa salina]KIG16929.1 hypothetical protein DB30_03913 [Enhygromyxa salina]
MNDLATRLSSIALPAVIGLTAALALPQAAQARKNNKPVRKGGQAEVMVGASACIPGKGECTADGLGETAPSVGMAFDVGWRAHKAFFVGAGYSVGWFNPTWQDVGQQEFRSAHQQGVFGILRAYIPIWRLDIGFELAPGWSRQAFVAAGGGSRTYSQGFALRPGLSLDIWLGRHVFVGAKVDFTFNFHGEVCEKTKAERVCTIERELRQSRVHQLIGGVHVGGSF